MSKGSCFFQGVNGTVSENALLSMLGCVQPRPNTRVRQDPVSGAYHSSYTPSVIRMSGYLPCEAQICLCEGDLKGPPRMLSWKCLFRGMHPSKSWRVVRLQGPVRSSLCANALSGRGKASLSIRELELLSVRDVFSFASSNYLY